MVDVSETVMRSIYFNFFALKIWKNFYNNHHVAFALSNDFVSFFFMENNLLCLWLSVLLAKSYSNMVDLRILSSTISWLMLLVPCLLGWDFWICQHRRRKSLRPPVETVWLLWQWYGSFSARSIFIGLSRSHYVEFQLFRIWWLILNEDKNDGTMQ